MDDKTLILTEPQIKKLITMPEVLAAVKKAFVLYGKNAVKMPAKIYLEVEKYSGDFRAMPAYIEEMGACGLKWVNVHPQNFRNGMPTVMAVIILNDPKSGFPLSLMAANTITNLRTGAAGGIAAQALARKNSSVIALLGCGAQARTQLLALKEIFSIDRVNVWGNLPELSRKFIKDNRGLKLKMEAKEEIPDCVAEADIIVTTTPAKTPILKAEWVRKGTHINAIGADAQGKEELDPALLKNGKVVIDDWTQASHSGEINVPVSQGILTAKDIHATLGEILVGKKKGRVNSQEITIFDSTGLAIQDIAVAQLIYKKALKTKVGKGIRVV